MKKPVSKSPTKSAKSHLTEATTVNNNNTTSTHNTVKYPKISDRIINTYNISPGMAYDDWAKTRDQFLSRHNMVTKID